MPKFSTFAPPLLVLSLVVIGEPTTGSEPSPFDPCHVDYTQNESAPRPAPAWVRTIDQGERDPRLAGLQTPEGIRVEIVAQEPVVINPVGLTFDPQGTPHVLEWRVAPHSEHITYEVQFQDGTAATVNRMRKGVYDELKTLYDSDGEGHYDRASVVMDDLEIPSSVLLDGEYVYLTSIGHVVRRTRDANGAWTDEELVRGLCGFHHHQASGLTLSPDGWLFVSSGDDDNRAEGSDGSRATVLRTGAVFRCRPNGSQLHEFARGFRNPYRDVAFDPMFNMFHVDNDQEDGSKFQGVRLMHVVDGADYGWRLAQGTICCRTDFARGAVFGEGPGKLPSMLKTGRGAPAGLLIYQGTAFPDFFRGLLIYPDVYRKMVRAYRVERVGTTFAVVEQFELMKSDDPLFRPCQATVGPDGAIYIVDWRTDSGGAGRLWGDGQHGRIYRLTWSGTPDVPAIQPGSLKAWAGLAQANASQLLASLESPDAELRKRALRELVRRGPRSREALLRLARDASHRRETRAAALAGAAQLYDLGVQSALVALLTSDDDPELRRWSAELIGRNAPPQAIDDTLLAALQVALGDAHPAVRRSTGVALGQLSVHMSPASQPRQAAAQALLAAYLAAPADDPYLKDGLLRGIERTGSDGIMLVEQLARSDQPEDREQAIAAIEALRTADVVPALTRLLEQDANLTSDQTRRVIATYWSILIEPPVDPAPIVRWLSQHEDAPDELQLAALTAIAKLGGTQGDANLPIVLKLLDHADDQFRVGVIQVIADNEIRAAAPSLVARLRQAKGSVAEHQAIVQALGRLRQQELPWGGRTPPGVELLLDELVDLAAVPELSSVRPDLVATISTIDFARGLPLAEALLQSGDATQVRSAIHILGADRDYAQQLAERYLAGEFDRALLPEVSSALQRHIPRDSSGQLSQLLQQVLRNGLLVSLDPQQVARVESLVSTTGIPARGQQIFFDSQRSQCATCHQLEGRGQQVGPDLTRIWDTHTVAKIMESMIEPSKEIKEGYAAFTAITDGGQVYTGLKISADDKHVVLRDPQGKDVVLPRDEIDELVESDKSLMPEGLIAQLSFQEFIDLVAFLKDRTAQQVLRDE